MDIDAQVAQHTAELRDLRCCMDEVGDAVLGTRKTMFAGGGREEDGLIHSSRSTAAELKGLKDGLAVMQARFANGGVRTRLSPKDRLTLWCAIIAALAVVIAGALGAFA